MRESNFAFPPQNRACVCITSQLYDRRALDATSALPLYNSLTHLVYLTSTSPRIREILTLDGGLERLVRILRDFCANPPRRRDAAWIYALSPPGGGPSSDDDLPSRIEHRISPTVFDPADDDNTFFLESSSRAELEKAAHHLARFRIGAQRPSEAAFQKPHPTAHSIPYIPTPGTPFPYQIDPLAARTFSLAFQSVVNIGVRGSEHIRQRVVQAGALGVVSCILAVWLKGKGFAIGPSATGSGAPRESREVRVRRREEALERQRAIDLARALESAAADGGRSRPSAPPAPRLAINAQPNNIRQANPSSDEGDEEMSASDLGPSPTPPPVRVGATGRSMSNDSDGSYAGVPSAAAVVSAPGPSGPAGAFAPLAAPVQRSYSHSGNSIPSYGGGSTPYDPPMDGPVSVPARTVSPIPIASGSHPPARTISPVAGTGRAISPNTAQSSDASANATPVGSGTPTGSVVVPGRDRSGTVVGRPVWDVPRTGAWDGQAVWEAPANAGAGAGHGWDGQQRAGWTDGQRGGWDDDGAAEDTVNAGAIPGRRGTITRRPRRERDTDGDDTEADVDDGAAQGERRTVGIVDAADGDGAMAMDMMGEGVGVGVVALEQNDDLAMGAPPGAPGAVPVGVGVGVGVGIATPRARVPGGNELTPRAGLANLGVGVAEAAVPEPRRVGVSNPSVNPGPYGDEEVLFSLQLLAYLSKYPHVRQAFYETPPTLRALVDASSEPRTSVPATSTAQSPNVFSLVERFTFRPSPSETTLPRLPQEIQYWAGVIMRNACRKDDQRNGIRQCANMLCGRWEDFPREFAKCRRCRKAKYCGKECQSKAWAEGHRFWCSAREEDDGATVVARAQRELPNAPTAVATEVEVPTRRGLTTTVTRALVNIAGGMTGRTTPANTTPVAAPTPARAGGGATVPDLMIHANVRPPQQQQQQQQQQTIQGLARTGIISTALQGPPSAGMAGRGAGMRVVRPLALPAGARPGNWTGARGPIFADAQPQPSATTPDAGPSRRARLPETARRRSGTVPSGGTSFDFGREGQLEVGGHIGPGGRVIPPGGEGAGAREGEAWRVVPVQRVSPTPSAPHTTPLHAGRALEDEGDDMVLG